MERTNFKLLYTGILFGIFISCSDSTCCKLRASRKLGLVNYWPVDGTTNDHLGTAHMYGLVNAKLTTDRFGNANSAISFTNGYAQVPPGVYFAGEFSVMAWIKAKENGYWARIFDFVNGPKDDNVLISYTVNRTFALNVQIFVKDVKRTVDYNHQIRLNEWTHIAFVHSLFGYKVYINGTLLHTLSNTVLARNLTRTRCYIGKSNWDWDSMANADMDDIKIFNIVLSDTDVKFHYKSNVVFVV